MFRDKLCAFEEWGLERNRCFGEGSCMQESKDEEGKRRKEKVDDLPPVSGRMARGGGMR